MRVFLFAFVAATLIGVGAAGVLLQFQSPAKTAFSTSAVRI
ncbi:MAG: hypothetical protein V7606_4792 [Burkholderiales bacterium]|jgi:hypothetical protein